MQRVPLNLKNKYWPIKGNGKNILRQCFRPRPPNLCQALSYLPGARINPSKLFDTVVMYYVSH